MPPLFSSLVAVVRFCSARWWRWVVVLPFFLGACTLYEVVVNYLDDSLSVLSGVLGPRSHYTFYSGSPGGAYVQIGAALEKKYEDQEGDFLLTAVETGGGFENAVQVRNHDKSLALTKESIPPSQDPAEQRMVRVAPLYMERLHVLYRRSKFEESMKRNCPGFTAASGNAYERLGIDVSTSNGESAQCLASFFSESRVATGPVGSGTNVFASYLLTTAALSPKQIINTSSSDAVERLLGDSPGDEVDIVFTMAGAPLNGVCWALDRDKDIRLMGVQPSLIAEVNSRYGSKLRIVDFHDKYDGGDINTAGGYAYLVASPDVPRSVLDGVLSTLAEVADTAIDLAACKSKKSPLAELDFSHTHARDVAARSVTWTRKIVICFSSVMALLVFALSATWTLWSTINYERLVTRLEKQRIRLLGGMKQRTSPLGSDDPQVELAHLESLLPNDPANDSSAVGAVHAVRLDARRAFVDGRLAAAHMESLVRLANDVGALVSAQTAGILARLIRSDDGYRTRALQYGERALSLGVLTPDSFARVVTLTKEGPAKPSQ